MENKSSTSNRSSYYGGEIESSSSSSSSSVVFFPSLEELVLYGLLKLKGWWRVGDDQVVVGNECCINKTTGLVLPPFPRLSILSIYSCPQLTSIPPCSNLEDLRLDEVNEMLRIKEEENLGGEVEVEVSGSEGSSSVGAGDSRNQKHDGDDPKLRRVFVYKVGYLKCLPMRAFRCLREMEIFDDSEVESLSETEDVFRNCSSSLRSLDIRFCSKLMNVSGLEHLAALEELSLNHLDELSFDEDDTPWRSLGQSLRSLDLRSLRKMEKLPKGMRHLTSLHSLTIDNCPALEELPEWIDDGCFSSLQSLSINKCHKMKSLPNAMRNLTSLTKLDIRGCPELV